MQTRENQNPNMPQVIDIEEKGSRNNVKRGRAKRGSMPTGEMEAKRGNSGQATTDAMQRVIVEMLVPVGQAVSATREMAHTLRSSGFQLDTSYEPVPVKPTSERQSQLRSAGRETVVVRGIIRKDMVEDLKRQPNVLNVYEDTEIAPFSCPIPPCDCDPRTARGTIADVARYLGVDQIWSSGHKGQGLVAGVVHGGITAIGRPVRQGETPKIPRVIGGWPTQDWGTTAAAWGDHGNMCSTDVLGMAAEAQIHDIRISGAAGIPGTISNALAGFQWAIDQHRSDGTPHILTNSWGIFQED
jgi:serine protease AprX